MSFLIPIGVESFRKLVETESAKGYKYIYADKTLFIQEALEDGAMVSVITRPRRFGKSLNLSMLQHYLSLTVDGKPTAHLFNGLKISFDRACCEKYQGKFPVIFITFADVKCDDFQGAIEKIELLIKLLYNSFMYLSTSDKLNVNEKIYFNQIAAANQPISRTLLEESIKMLSSFLYTHHGQDPYILIDEYDTPIHAAYINGYYKKAVRFFRSFFSSTLKTNKHYSKAVLTGITRVSKESLFSGVNNLKMRSVLDQKYSEYFGFTEEEVNEIFNKAKVKFDVETVKKWYNGYNFGSTTIFNPWSIIECLEQGGKLNPYWINTSGNDIIADLIAKSDAAVKSKLTELITGNSIKEIVDEHIVFGALIKNPAAIWSLLLMGGYLSNIASESQGSRYLCELKIPNKEVEDFYCTVVREWINTGNSTNLQQELIDSLLVFDIATFEEKLSEIVETVLSFRDVTKKTQEAFYHGLTLGIVAGVHETYEVQSNKESALGFYDLALIPKDPGKPGIIIELKATPKAARLNIEAKAALKQIASKKYSQLFKPRGIKTIYKIGIAFSGKKIKVAAEGR